MLIESKMDMSFTRTAGIEEGDYAFVRLPPELMPEDMAQGAEDLSQYAPAQDIRENRRDLTDAEAIKPVLLIYVQRFEQIDGIIRGMYQGMSSLTPEQTANLNLEKRRRNAILDKIQKSMRTASIISAEHKDILWAIGDRLDVLGNQLPSDTSSEIIMQWASHAPYELTLQQATDAWNKYLAVLKSSDKPFLTRIGQLTDVDSALVELSAAVDILLDSLMQLHTMTKDVELSLNVMPRAAMLKTGQVDPYDPFDDLQQLPIDNEEFVQVALSPTDTGDPVPPEIPKSPWYRLAYAGHYRLVVAINYTKVTPPETGVTSTYMVEPYSMRLRQNPEGLSQYYFFGYDTEDGHIKMFIYKNIHSVEITNETYSPRWSVEFEYKG